MNEELIPKKEDIDISPGKSFFVHMLTRDIALSDAILDLLDNCVDGILRAKIASDGDKPYSNYWAKITIAKDQFILEDNCGGIPWENRSYAFKLGRPADYINSQDSTIGTYGIGMKRAIFKMGENAVIHTKTKTHAYKVSVNKPWLTSDSWKLPLEEEEDQMEVGTKIIVSELLEGVKDQFSDKSFLLDLKKQIASLYAFILAKGFSVTVNEEKIIGKPTQLIFSEESGIKPYIYKDEIDGVEVFLTVGFTRPLPSEDEIDQNNNGSSYSSLDAGWTVVCNDRAVLYCNRDELTGWGEAGVPQYHTQFIAIAGIVEFKCSDARNLPMTTTKRGIDASSRLYLQVKNKMREGIKLFINYTNQWKRDWNEGKKKFSTSSESLTLAEIKHKIEQNTITLTVKQTGGEIFSPKLPLPEKGESDYVRISFKTLKENPQLVAQVIFGEENADNYSANKVGEECFNYFLKRVK